MTRNDFIAAAIPPFLALILELWNPVSDPYLDREATTLARRHGLPPKSEELIANNAKGVAAISDLTTTIVSFFTGLGILLLGLREAPVYLYLLLIAGIVVTLIAVRIVLTNPPFAIATKLLPRPLRIGGAFVRVTLGELFKVFAWLANLILIGVVILIYFDILPGG